MKKMIAVVFFVSLLGGCENLKLNCRVDYVETPQSSGAEVPHE